MLGKSRMPLSPGLFRKITLQTMLIVPFVVQTVGAVAVVVIFPIETVKKQ